MEEIYFDNAATTKTRIEVAKTVVEIMCQQYGNPSSLHELGFKASQRLQRARNQVATAISCSSEEIVFTSGGTEANNLAILGAASAQKRRGKKIITTQVEHSSVLNSVEHLGGNGYDVVYLKPLPNGDLDLTALKAAVDDDTILVTIGMVNSELGTITPIAEAVRVVKGVNPNTIFHTDAVQALGKIPFSPSRLGVDLLSISGHKIQAPKGVGALFIKDGVRILPICYGGSQEQGLRPGTENTPGICAFGHGAHLASINLNENLGQVTGLCKYFVNKANNLMGIRMNSTGEGTPYICNLSVPGYRSETLLHYLADHNIYVSSGSACAKGAKSHVLKAIGLSNQRIDSALRISFCPENTTQQIDFFFETLKQAREDLIRS